MNDFFKQLSQVDEALKVCGNETERSSLENLRSDLQEILDLTRETLNEQQKGSNAEGASTNDDDDQFAQEMALFMSEINETENGSANNDTAITQQNDEVLKFKAEVDSLIGKKCSAPYTFAWGAKSYHNALVCGLETDINQIQSMDDIKVTVLFTNPIHRNMVPCPFYLDGNCRFDFNKCR